MSSMSDKVLPAGIDLAQLRARLEKEGGPQFWRSLEELADAPEVREFLANEFGPHGAPVDQGVSRRGFLSLVAASLALAGLASCDRPREVIVPYVKRPEDILPGKTLTYATAMESEGGAVRLLVKSHMGRPIKVEGNPDHPASLGATDAVAQASILSLYDPDRSQVLRHLGQISTWDAFLTNMSANVERHKIDNGKGLRILSEPVVSPTLADQRRRLLEAFPDARWHQYTPINRDNIRAGALTAFGRDLHPQYDFEKADVILAIDSDFMMQGAGRLAYARQFADRRRVEVQDGEMSRLYSVECTPTVTGAMADHRWPLNPREIGAFVRALTLQLTRSREQPEEDCPVPDHWLDALVEDLRTHSGRAVIVVGDQQPADIHAAAHVINEAIGAFGAAVHLTEPIEAEPVDQGESLKELVSAIRQGNVETLLVLDGNPVYAAPGDVEFAKYLEQVPLRIHVGEYHDETAHLCHWHVPRAHFLETWSDTRSFDGTVSIVQPLIAPLYEGKSLHEFIAVWLGESGQSGQTTVKNVHRAQRSVEDFESWWHRTLHDGVMHGTKYPSVKADVRTASRRLPDQGTIAETDPATLHLILRPDPTIRDGRFANNGWLQELPKPLTKLTWDNAAHVSPSLAERLSLANGDVVACSIEGRTTRAPVWIVPGQAPDCVTLHIGHGRKRAGRVGTGVGIDVHSLRTTAAPWGAPGVTLAKTGEARALSCTQDHHGMEGRHHVRSGSVQQFRRNPEFVKEFDHGADLSLSLYPEHENDGYAWGMTIDLNACIGCNACVTACQAENNIPIVGPEEVRRGREMHWIRVDRYFSGTWENPDTHFQPVPCMHCEDAPCEVVCPVSATVHSAEGLNDMVYNRCVGTRYCSNNCPYKVRRFNFYEYADFETPSLKLLYNPDVTVRSRGVMEKCTYCVQRINAARIEAKKEDRRIRDGEVVTACQAACPTQAILFGDLNDPQSRLSKAKRSHRNYPLLGELNTKPRTTYLAALHNPNPRIQSESDDA